MAANPLLGGGGKRGRKAHAKANSCYRGLSSHCLPGVNHTPDGWRKIRFESHNAVNTWVRPGSTFTIVEVGWGKPTYDAV
jgi:hypothetical protein